ncbi:putative nuclease HARBI1 [Diabrotica virgifera virgifera]|uniref:Putative nuclease HARBI1 n=1 Tax=Diabrotica virgifera virgifera TaxID=50390 RepID=A0ABM5JSD4_DIAVI|nr:putative nuclease HARBI1 [Diabrotica virgifera virgifera]
MLDRYEAVEELLERIDHIVEENHLERIRKRYIRDMENPMEFYQDVEFRRRYRFNKDTVADTILPLVFEDLRKPDNRGLPIPPMLQLLTCLRCYATCNFQLVSGDLRGVSQAAISRIIKKVSVLLAQSLNRFVGFPHTGQGFRRNITSFYEVAHFPNVSGCIDCTHIKIANPGGNNGEVFRNRKGFFSLNVQVVSGPRREIMDIVVRHPGSSHDSLIFDRSALRVRMERGEIPGLLVGDSGYPCRRYLLTPVLHPGNDQENRYNSAHISTRNIVERLFGTWKRRFPCLQQGLKTKLNTSLAIICATAVLHNIGLQENDNEDDAIVENIDVPDNRNVNDVERGLNFRRQFIQQHFA